MEQPAILFLNVNAWNELVSRLEDPVQRNLCHAFSTNDIDAVRDILHQDPEIKLLPDIARTDQPNTQQLLGEIFLNMLLNQISGGNLEMVELMLKVGAHVVSTIDHIESKAFQKVTHLVQDPIRFRMAKLLIDAGLSPDTNQDIITAFSYPPAQYSTPLHQAVTILDMNLIKLFMDAGVSLQCLDSSGLGPIHYLVSYYTIEESRSEFLKLFCEAGADINSISRDGSSVLHYLCKKPGCSWDSVKIFLDLGANLNVTNKRNISPLALAAAANQYELVKKMLEAGADVNISGKCSGSPLQLAVSMNNKNIVELLLSEGANVNARDETGNNILYHAAELKFDLPEDGRNNVAAHVDSSAPPMTANDNLSILRMLLAHGALVDCPQYGKYKPFKSALRSGNMEIVNIFLENGVELETSGIDFPLHNAVCNKNREVMKYLLEKNLCDVDQMDSNGMTPLFIAVFYDNYPLVVELFEAGANINIPCTEIGFDTPRTLLSKAILRSPYFKEHRGSSMVPNLVGDFRTVCWLLSVGANIDESDAYCVCKIFVETVNSHSQMDPEDFAHLPASQRRETGIDLYRAQIILDLLIAQVALLKSRNYQFTFKYEEYFMEKFPSFESKFKNCENDLELLKTCILFDSITLYDVLIGRDTTRIVNHENVIEVLGSQRIFELSPMYGNRLRDSFLIAKAKRRIMDDAVKVLGKLLGSDFMEKSLILHTIMEYLEIKDLLNLKRISP